MSREKKLAMALAMIGKGVDAGDPRFKTETGQRLYLFDMDPVNWEVSQGSSRADVQEWLAYLIEAGDVESYNRAAKSMCFTAAALEARKAIGS